MTGLCSPFWTIQRRNVPAAILPVVYWNAPRALTPYSSAPLRRPSGRRSGGRDGTSKVGRGRWTLRVEGKSNGMEELLGTDVTFSPISRRVKRKKLRTKNKNISLVYPYSFPFRIIKETTANYILYLYFCFVTQRNRTLANF